MYFYFFFQAEDGIRDYKVTGVQTCALPISSAPVLPRRWKWPATVAYGPTGPSAAPTRSEERRVGKECRSRGSPYHYKKKTRSMHEGAGQFIPINPLRRRLLPRWIG